MRFSRTAALAFLAAVMLTLSCVDGDAPTRVGAGESVQLSLSPRFVGPLRADPPGDITRIRVTARVVEAGSVLGSFVTEVQPTDTAWVLSFEAPVPPNGEEVILLVELLSVVNGVEVVEWSGELGPMELRAGIPVRSAAVDLYRGPPGNLTVTGLTLSPDSTGIFEGDTVRLSAEVESTDPEQAPQPFWTSLDTLVASVDGEGLVLGLTPGRARVVAEAGTAADTSVVRVSPGPVEVTILPDTAVLVGVGDTITFSGTVRDVRGDPLSGWSLGWRSLDTTVVRHTEAGRFESVAPGLASVEAFVLEVPAVRGTAWARVVRPVADVRVRKAGASTAFEGDTVTFTVQATNLGPDDATDVEVEELLPGGLTLLDAAVSGAGGFDVGTRILTSPELAAGDSVTLTLRATVDPDRAGQTLTNRVLYLGTSPAVDPVATNDTSSVAVAVLERVTDLAVVKSALTPLVVEGGSGLWEVTVTNSGPWPATGIEIDDAVGPGLAVDSARVTAGAFDVATGVWSLAALAVGASETLTLHTTVQSGSYGAPLTNAASLRTSTPRDTIPANDTASASAQVRGIDLQVLKTADVADADVGDTIRYAVMVANLGTVAATGIEIVDTIPAPLAVDSASASMGAWDAGTFIWSIPVLLPEETATLGLRAVLGVGAEGAAIVNEARRAYSIQTDTFPANDVSAVGVNILLPDLLLTKAASTGAPTVGAAFDYTLELVNLGPGAAGAVVVRDLLPAGMTFQGAVAEQGSYDEGTGDWAVGPVASGDTVSLTLSVVPDVGLALTEVENVAFVVSLDRGQLTQANDTASVLVSVPAQPQGAAYEAPGNTQLVIGAYPAPGTIHVSSPTGLLDGTPTLTAVAETVATSLGGTAVIEADGSALYTPPLGVEHTTDAFYYRVDTGDSALVSVALSERVWYLDGASSGAGTSSDPAHDFDLIEASTGAGDILYFASGAYFAPVRLQAGQQLIGAGAPLVVPGFDTLAVAGVAPTIEVEGTTIEMADSSAVRGVVVPAIVDGIVADSVSDIVIEDVSIEGSFSRALLLRELAGSNTIENLVIDGTSTFSAMGIEVFGGTGTTSVQAAVSLQNGLLVQVDSTEAGSSFTFGGSYSIAQADTAVRIVDVAGDVAFDSVSVAAFRSCGVCLQGVDGSVGFTHLDVDNTVVGAFGPGIAAHGGSGVIDIMLDPSGMGVWGSRVIDVFATEGLDLTIGGGPIRNVSESRGLWFDGLQPSAGGDRSQVTIDSDVELAATSDNPRAIWVVNSDGEFTFNGAVTIDASGTEGIAHEFSLGDVVFNGPVDLTVSNSGTGIWGYLVGTEESGFYTPSGSFDFPGGVTIAATDAVAVEVFRSPFSGVFNDVTVANPSAFAQSAIRVSESPGLKEFRAPLSLDHSGANPAISLLDAGEVTATGAGSIVSATAGEGVHIENTAIGATGVTLESVSMSGGSHAVYLAGTGSGPFAITGAGGVPGSGGVIDGPAGVGIWANGTGPIELNLMDIRNAGFSAISTLGTGEVTLRDTQVSYAPGHNAPGLRFIGSSGDILLERNTLGAPGQWSIEVDNNVTDMTIELRDNSVAGGGSGGVQLFAANGTVSATLSGNAFAGDSGWGVSGLANSGGVLNLDVSGTPNTFTGFGRGVSLSTYGDGLLDFAIEGNEFVDPASAGVALYADTSSTSGVRLRGSITGNAIRSAAALGNGITADLSGDAEAEVVIDANEIDLSAGGGEGIVLRAGQQSGDAPLARTAVRFNAIEVALDRYGFDLQSDFDATVCLDARLNTVEVAPGTESPAAVIRQYLPSAFLLERFTGDGTDGVQVEAHLEAENVLSDGAFASLDAGGGFTGVTDGACGLAAPALADPDVVVLKTATDGTPSVDVPFDYVVEVRNEGLGAAGSVVVRDVLPVGMTFEAAVVTQGSYDLGSGGWVVGTLLPGAVDSLVITVTPGIELAGGPAVTNTAYVVSLDRAQASTANDTASVEVTVPGVPLPAAYAAPGNTQLVIGAYPAPSTIHVADGTGLLASTPEFTAVADTVATSLGGTAVIEADGSALYTPPVGVENTTDGFYYTVNTGDSALVSVTLSESVWYIDNTLSGAGTSNDPAGSFGAVSDYPPGPNDVFYIATGEGTYTDQWFMDTGQRVVGEGSALVLAGFGELAPAGVAPVFAPGPYRVFWMGDSTVVEGVEIAAGADEAIYADGVSDITVDNVVIDSPVFDGRGLNLRNLGGTNELTNVDITSGNTAIAIEVFGGTGTINVLGNVAATAGQLIQVDSTAPGSLVTFAGNYSAVAADTAIRVVGVAGEVIFGSVSIDGADYGVALSGIDGDVAFGLLGMGTTVVEAFTVTGGGEGTIAVNVDASGFGTAQGSLIRLTNLTGVDVAFTGGAIASATRGIFMDNVGQSPGGDPSVVTFTNPVQLDLVGEDAIVFQNSDGEAVFAEADLRVDGGRAIYAASNGLGSLSVSGTVHVVNSVGVLASGSALDLALDTLTVVNNTGGAAAVQLDSSPGTKSVGYLDLESDGPFSQTLSVFEGGEIFVTDPASRIVSTAGTAILFSEEGSPTHLDMTLGEVSSTTTAGSFSDGVSLGSSTGRLDILGGTIANGGSASASAVRVSGGSADISFGGAVVNSAGPAVSVIARSGGTIDFTGTVSSTAGGVSFTESTGAALRFSGGLDLSTGTGPGIDAGLNAASTLEVTGPSTVTTTTGVPVLIVDTEIGPLGVTFEAINSDGSANGIYLSNVGSGPFLVTGDGTPLSGGVLRRPSSTGVFLQGAGLVELRDMAVDTAAAVGIQGDNVAAVLLDRVSVKGAGSDGLWVSALDSIVLDSTSITGSAGTNATVAAPLVRVLGSTLDDTEPGVGAQGLQVVVNDGSMVLDLQNSSMSGNYLHGVQILTGGTASVDLTARGLVLVDNGVANLGMTGGGAGDLTGTVVNSYLRGGGSYGAAHGIYLGAQGSGRLSVQVDSVTIDDPDLTSGGQPALEIDVWDGSTATVSVANSSLLEHARAIRSTVGTGDLAARLDLILDQDALTGSSAYDALPVVELSAGLTSAICIDARNTGTGGYGGAEWAFAAASGASVDMVGYTGDPVTTFEANGVFLLDPLTLIPLDGFPAPSASQTGAGSFGSCVLP